jgi:hypothetical protein
MKIVNVLETAHTHNSLESAVAYIDEIQQGPATSWAYGNLTPSEVASFARLRPEERNRGRQNDSYTFGATSDVRPSWPAPQR